jgi:hypothetical protein
MATEDSTATEATRIEGVCILVIPEDLLQWKSGEERRVWAEESKVVYLVGSQRRRRSIANKPAVLTVRAMLLTSVLDKNCQ